MILPFQQALDDLAAGIIGIGNEIEILGDIEDYQQGDHFIEQGSFITIRLHNTFVDSHHQGDGKYTSPVCSAKTDISSARDQLIVVMQSAEC